MPSMLVIEAPAFGFLFLLGTFWIKLLVLRVGVEFSLWSRTAPVACLVAPAAWISHPAMFWQRRRVLPIIAVRGLWT